MDSIEQLSSKETQKIAKLSFNFKKEHGVSLNVFDSCKSEKIIVQKRDKAKDRHSVVQNCKKQINTIYFEYVGRYSREVEFVYLLKRAIELYVVYKSSINNQDVYILEETGGKDDRIRLKGIITPKKLYKLLNIVKEAIKNKQYKK
ncbi:MAG: hypothetical protein KBS65_06750 [Prevotella sp.]|nr:hypothetical protein [Candidatus Equicola stercoris]